MNQLPLALLEAVLEDDTAAGTMRFTAEEPEEALPSLSEGPELPVDLDHCVASTWIGRQTIKHAD